VGAKPLGRLSACSEAALLVYFIGIQSENAVLRFYASVGILLSTDWCKTPENWTCSVSQKDVDRFSTILLEDPVVNLL